MKKLLLTLSLGFCLASLAACTTSMQKDTATPVASRSSQPENPLKQGTQEPAIGMANPASEFCIQQGGHLEIRKEADGEVGYCHLPDGRVVEEWAFFRANSAR